LLLLDETMRENRQSLSKHERRATVTTVFTYSALRAEEYEMPLFDDMRSILPALSNMRIHVSA
jgi:hypothetical protein